MKTITRNKMGGRILTYSVKSNIENLTMEFNTLREARRFAIEEKDIETGNYKRWWLK